MKSVIITFILACSTLLMASCLDNTGSDPEPIVEPLGRSYYYVDNQSQSNLNVVYKITGFPVDSTVSVPSKTMTKFFQLARSNSPKPSEAFDNLRFYNAADGNTSPIYTVDPIGDDNWNDVTAEADTVKKYKLIITNEDVQ